MKLIKNTIEFNNFESDDFVNIWKRNNVYIATQITAKENWWCAFLVHYVCKHSERSRHLLAKDGSFRWYNYIFLFVLKVMCDKIGYF